MLEFFKQMFCKHRWTVVLSDPDGEFDVGDDTYDGTVDLYTCVDCGKLESRVKFNCKYPFGHPKYVERD